MPLTSYSTAKLAKSSGVSSPWEAYEISGFVIADLYHVASCCICILAALVVVNLFVLHIIKYDSVSNVNDHLWLFEVVSNRYYIIDINSVYLNGLTGAIHQVREPGRLEL